MSKTSGRRWIPTGLYLVGTDVLLSKGCSRSLIILFPLVIFLFCMKTQYKWEYMESISWGSWDVLNINNCFFFNQEYFFTCLRYLLCCALHARWVMKYSSKNVFNVSFYNIKYNVEFNKFLMKIIYVSLILNSVTFTLVCFDCISVAV